MFKHIKFQHFMKKFPFSDYYNKNSQVLDFPFDMKFKSITKTQTVKILNYDMTVALW